MRKTQTIVIGAGPAGLTAAYLLSKAGQSVTVIERDSRYVGGISRTVDYKGFLFDIGGHRFFSKSREVEDLWTELLPDDMLNRPRSSRIYYNGKFFAYPLKAGDALRNLGFVTAALCALSYARARAFPRKNPENFEEWVTNEFGARLFRIFFKTYTEKVWGMSCRDISADWAAQRIKGLSLATAVANAFGWERRIRAPRETIKTLINSFRYPRKGPGMLWESCARKTIAQGGVIEMGWKVVACERDERAGEWRVAAIDGRQQRREFSADHVISTAPLRELVQGLVPPVSARALAAAGSLKYRDFLTVALILRDRNVFSDNWIYIHDPGVKVGRIQNFKSWSPEMIPDPALTCYGLEYFCFEGDGLWAAEDAALVALATDELVKIGLAARADVLDGCVVRQAKAYPVYDGGYKAGVRAIRDEIGARYPNLHVVGRNGMHKYNNQDHSMMTAMLCVKNILAGRPLYDLWEVNDDAQYHESGRTDTPELGVRAVPGAIAPVPRTLSVIVPVFNEIATARSALDAIVAKQIPGWEIEIILVESTSTDGTRDVVLGYREHPRVKLILEDRPYGKGHAVRAGLAQATGAVILIQDADLEYDLADYEVLLAPIVAGRQAFVLGSRHGQGGFAIRRFSDQPLHAFVLNAAHWTFTLLLNASLGIWLRDPFTMYKVFRRDCLEGLTFECDRFDFDWELLIKLVRKGYRPIEIPISYHSRSFKEGKKIRIFRDPLTWIRAMVKSRLAKL